MHYSDCQSLFAVGTETYKMSIQHKTHLTIKQKVSNVETTWRKDVNSLIHRLFDVGYLQLTGVQKGNIKKRLI